MPGDTTDKRGHQPRWLPEEPSFNIHGGAGREAFDLVCFAILLELNSHLPADTCHMSPQLVPWSIAAAERRLTYRTLSTTDTGQARGQSPAGTRVPIPGAFLPSHSVGAVGCWQCPRPLRAAHSPCNPASPALPEELMRLYSNFPEWWR